MDGRRRFEIDLCSILLIKDNNTADRDAYPGLDDDHICVSAAPQLMDDIQALAEVLKGVTPWQRLVRAIGLRNVWYGGGLPVRGL